MKKMLDTQIVEEIRWHLKDKGFLMKGGRFSLRNEEKIYIEDAVAEFLESKKEVISSRTQVSEILKFQTGGMGWLSYAFVCQDEKDLRVGQDVLIWEDAER